MTKPINAFPGYEFVLGDDGHMHNMYRGEDIGMGGYIRSNPGIYYNVALLDVSSMHPSSIIALNYFGKYTDRYAQIKQMRVYIKHGDFDSVRPMFGGKVAKYLTDERAAANLAKAAKLPLNQTYGLTAAKFENPCYDPRNKNNIVALRGALFMKTLRDEIEARGYKFVAIKTDSIKIVEADKEIIDFCMEFGKKYGYEFEHEATYSKICQINDADYIAKVASPEWCEERYGYAPSENKNHGGEWTATGARFQAPYIFKSLFSHEPFVFDDYCEVKSVKKGAIYLARDEALTKNPQLEKELKKVQKQLKDDPENQDLLNIQEDLKADIAKEHNYIFVGRVGQFTPIKPGCGGGVLVCINGDKIGAVSGTKGYRWLESEMVRELGLEDQIDKEYHRAMVDEAKALISQYGDFEAFVA